MSTSLDSNDDSNAFDQPRHNWTRAETGANSIFIGDILLTTKNPRTSHDAGLLGRLDIASKLGDAAPAEVQVTTQVAAQIAI
jgi:hypothetical protein